MPCDIGYRNISKISVPAKTPQEFKTKTKFKVDEDLFNKIGIEDLVFVNWVIGLDIDPLLKEALKRTLNNLNTKGINFSVVDGELTISAKYTSSEEKREIEKIAKKVSERFQIETIGIIAQLLDYKIVITEKSRTLVLEGEKDENSAVHKYMKVEIGQDQNGVIAFEHFESAKAAKEEKMKFLALAERFGIKVNFNDEYEAGSPIAQNIEHKNFLKVS